MDIHFYSSLSDGSFTGDLDPAQLYNGFSSTKFPEGNDNYLTITGPGHPFLTGAETFHTPSLGDEEFEIPPISLDSDHTLAVSDVVGQYDLEDPGSTEDGGFSTQYGVQTLDLPVSVSQAVLEQNEGILNTGLAMDLGHPIGTQYNANPPVTIDVPLTDMSSGLLSHSQLTTIDQSELSSQLGLSLGGGTILPRAQSPEDRMSTTPSPTNSLHEEDAEDFRRITAPKAVVVETARKGKTPKKRKKKDPNEPQKPVSAYALFFRDTQAAIKGQNPNATFGEVSKIVASMWDSLGEEQKQVYKRKTEAAKEEYSKALAAYKANQVSQTIIETVEPEPAETVVQSEESPASPSPSIVVTSNLSQCTSNNPLPTQTKITKIIIPKQMLESGQIPSSLAMSQGVVTVIPANIVTSRGLQIGQPVHQVQASQGQIVTRSVLQAAGSQQQQSQQQQVFEIHPPPPRLQPPPLQQMPQPVTNQTTVLQAPPPLQSMQMQPKVRLSTQLHQAPPPLQIKIVQPQTTATVLQIQPKASPALIQSTASPVMASPVASLEIANLPEPVEDVTEVAHQVDPASQEEVELVSSSPPPAATRTVSPEPRCVRAGCTNPPIQSKDWDNQYCSSECVVSHCRDVFMAWISSRNQGTITSVK
ncbi:TOX high mobility group box family member 4 isoform X2 [Protopterus annectens]|uniref:TOX high mobility group box family member 4 isoform X2 n=1 Tax=Protopterus annectens TaxID=7888 RepID=UPI001CFA27C2|nr:TOX high mobility group box family member 4 isoform X2 [Protopterus annectens]